MSSAIFWRIFCQTWIFRGVFSVNYYSRAAMGRAGVGLGDIIINMTNVYKYRLWSQRDIKIPMHRWFWKLGTLFFLVLGKLHNGPFLGIFRGGLDFLDPKIAPRGARDNLGVKKVLAPLEISLEWPIMQFARKKKIISRIFKISGALIVITCGYRTVPGTTVKLRFLKMLGWNAVNSFISTPVHLLKYKVTNTRRFWVPDQMYR